MSVPTEKTLWTAAVPVVERERPTSILRRMPIKWKIVSIAVSVNLIGLAIVFAGLTINSRTLFERNVAYSGTVLADIIGSNSRAALVFNDANAANDTLSALYANRRILRAVLYDAKGNPFAEYLRDKSPQAIALSRNAEVYTVSRDIRLEDKIVGRVQLTADMGDWEQTLFNLTIVFLLLAVLTVGATFLMAVFLQRIITTPINNLAAITTQISQRKDYDIQVQKTSEDEIGTLIDGFNAMLREIQRRDADLRASHTLLEQRVAERTRQLETLNKELEAFCYSVSHDLRAPLRSIDGFSNILVSDYASALDEVGRDRLERIRRAAQRMGMLIDDLLQLSRVTRVELKRENVDLTAIADEIAATLQRQDPERVAHFDIARGLSASGDPNLLRIAIDNLLNNAWKFTNRRSEARIEFGTEWREGHPVYFVRDNGAGFDMRYQGKLFNAFQRLHDVSEFPGTGIGLATVQRIVHRHHGAIWAEGRPDQGATFYFTLAPEAIDE